MNFKKLGVFSLGLILAANLVGCKPKDPIDPVDNKAETIVKEAAEYVWGMYYSKGTELQATGSFDLVKKAAYDGEVVDVAWTITVPEAMKDAIKLVNDESKPAYTTVYVGYYDGLVTSETNWTLTASFTYEGVTKTMEEVVGAEKATLHYTTPSLVLNTRADWDAEIASSTDAALNIKGIVTGILNSGSSMGSFYMQDGAGNGYYIYAPATKTALKVGDVIVATGKPVLYNGQQETSKGGTYGAAGGEITPTFLDASADFAAAASNKVFDNKYQNNLVELKNCKPTSVSGSYYYFTVGDGAAVYNVYGASHLLTDEQETAWKTAWTNAIAAGATFDIKGIATVYSNAIQIYPCTLALDVIYNLQVMTDAQKLAAVVENVKSMIPATEVLAETTITLDVPEYATITVANTTENGTVTVDGKVLTVKPTSAATANTLHFVVTVGAETSEFDVVLTTGSALIRPELLTAVVTDTDLVAYEMYHGSTKYINGEQNGYYLALSENPLLAAKWKVLAREGEEGKYNLMLGEKYVTLVASGKYGNITLADAAGAAWEWSSDFNTFTCTLDNGTFYMGSYSSAAGTDPDASKQRVNTSAISYLKADNYNVSQFPLQFALAPTPLKSVTEKGAEVTVSGIVVGFSSETYRNAFIYDGESVLFIYDSALKDVEIGSYVTVSGTVDVYKDLVELKSVKLLNCAKFDGNPELVAKEITIDEYMALSTVESGVYYKVTGGHLKWGTYNNKYYLYLYNADESKNAQTDTLDAVYAAAGFTIDAANHTITAPEGELVFYGISTGKGKLAFLDIQKVVVEAN